MNDHVLQSIDPAVLRTHRQWAVRIGPIAASYRSDRMFDSWTRYRFGGRHRRSAVVPSIVAIVALVGVAATAQAIAFPHRSPVPYELSLEIPEARPYVQIANRVAASPPTRRRHELTQVNIKQPRTSASEEGSTQALTTAIATGEVQEWSTGGVHGYIVPGPADIAAGISCRNYSVLTRKTGSPDMVKTGRQCSPADAVSDTAAFNDRPMRSDPLQADAER